MGLERKGFFMPFVREQSGGTPQLIENYNTSQIHTFTIPVGHKKVLAIAIRNSNSSPTSLVEVRNCQYTEIQRGIIGTSYGQIFVIDITDSNSTAYLNFVNNCFVCLVGIS